MSAQLTDRELLEFAAKAAGDVSFDRSGLSCLFLQPRNGRAEEWNPLTDDGDALRLAVKLKLDVAIDDYVQVSWWADQGLLQWVNEEDCRRAIVRAAAEIGKAMP